MKTLTPDERAYLLALFRRCHELAGGDPELAQALEMLHSHSDDWAIVAVTFLLDWVDRHPDVAGAEWNPPDKDDE